MSAFVILGLQCYSHSDINIKTLKTSQMAPLGTHGGSAQQPIRGIRVTGGKRKLTNRTSLCVVLVKTIVLTN